MDFKSDLKLQNEDDLSTSKNDDLDTVFTTQQTDSMFILTSDLKGYERRDIKIEINEDGSRITISGEKPNRGRGRRGFHKTFIIPEGVVLNKVKARFDQDESRLVIRMPKSVRGVTGTGIQEVKDAATSSLQNHETTNVDQEIQGSTDSKQEEITQNEVHKIQSENQDFEQQKVEKLEQPQQQQEEDNIQEAEEPPEKTSITYTPIILGSTLLASLIVVFFGFIRSKNESNKKTN